MIATLPALAEDTPWPKTGAGPSLGFEEARNSNTLTGGGLAELPASEMTAVYPSRWQDCTAGIACADSPCASRNRQH